MQEAVRAQRLTAGESATAPESAARLSVSLVGRLAIRFNGRSIELRTQKAGAVLSYLALTETKQESRERLVGLLWSRSDEEKARASLRQVVRELRSALRGGRICRLCRRAALDPARPRDRSRSMSKASSSWRKAAASIPLLLNTPQLDERILEGMDDLDPSFRVWVLAKRQTIHDTADAKPRCRLGRQRCRRRASKTRSQPPSSISIRPTKRPAAI